MLLGVLMEVASISFFLFSVTKLNNLIIKIRALQKYITQKVKIPHNSPSLSYRAEVFL